MCSTDHTTRQFKQPVFSIKVQYVLRRQRKNKLRFCTEESWDACFNFWKTGAAPQQSRRISPPAPARRRAAAAPEQTEGGREGESYRAEWGAGRAGWRRPGPRAPVGRQERGKVARKNASRSRSQTGKPPRAPLRETGGGEHARCQPGAPAAARASPSPSGAPSPPYLIATFPSE